MAPSSPTSGNASKTRIARSCPARICPKYASRSQPSMCSLALIATTAGTASERVTRVAR